MATGLYCSAAIFLFGGRSSGETRAVVGLEELLYITLCIEDFAVYAVVWYITLVAVILRSASAHSEYSGELSVSDEASAVQQRVITFPQIPAFVHYVVGLYVETSNARVIGCNQFLHTLAVSLVINPATSEPLNCDNRPICE